MNNILYKFKPVKILGKGSQGTVILTHDENYVVKIYSKKSKNLKMLVKILDFLINCNNLPKTIYRSYHITEQQNSLNRYLHNNLPQHFSFTNEDNLKKISKTSKIKPLLFEVMKTYNLTLRDFFENLINKNLNNSIKIEILHSLLYQGLFTLLWLYMKKGIVHLDINADNFFIEETKDKIFNIKINGITYNIKLYGYYLIIADFGYSRKVA
jgi:serine/threonine protein kinase